MSPDRSEAKHRHLASLLGCDEKSDFDLSAHEERNRSEIKPTMKALVSTNEESNVKISIALYRTTL